MVYIAQFRDVSLTNSSSPRDFSMMEASIKLSKHRNKLGGGNGLRHEGQELEGCCSPGW
jgi:hypothetical protein